MIALNPNVAMYLVGRYPGIKQAGLASMWIAAWAWIEERASPYYMKPGSIPPVFESVAILRVQFICAEGDAHAKQAFTFAAHELLSPYR